MSERTNIEWADSTLNLQMGCEGCELVKGGRMPTCYAKTLTDRYKGMKGWPVQFSEPKIFMDRLKKITAWKDLTGKERKDKPWLNGLPRIIFLNDMGDTFSRGMPEGWFADVLHDIANSPHRFLVLTKWPQRFVKFSQCFPLPENIWPGTSVTSQKTMFRARVLSDVVGGGPLWISAEPYWGKMNFDFPEIKKFGWIIFGGESGPYAQPCDVDDMQKNVELCYRYGITPFVKQLGSKPVMDGKRLYPEDSKGGDWMKWPRVLRVREMPAPPLNPLLVEVRIVKERE